MTSAIGFRVKSGWATAVLLGLAKSPQVLDRRIVELCDPAVPESRQPYHHSMGTAGGGRRRDPPADPYRPACCGKIGEGAALGQTENDVKRTISTLGRNIGGPWRADEKLATAAAWMQLVIAQEKR